MGYLLGRPYWGRGLATEAARVSVQYGFESLGVETIVAIVHPDNVASQRVIEKLGMSFTEEAHYFGMDCYDYSLNRSRFVEDARSWTGEGQREAPGPGHGEAMEAGR